MARLIHVVPASNPEVLRRALAQALDDATGKTAVAPITEAEREMLSWRAMQCIIWKLLLICNRLFVPHSGRAAANNEHDKVQPAESPPGMIAPSLLSKRFLHFR
jgi:hypothetical protein